MAVFKCGDKEKAQEKATVMDEIKTRGSYYKMDLNKHITTWGLKRNLIKT